jgi:hypothetical protein
MVNEVHRILSPTLWNMIMLFKYSRCGWKLLTIFGHEFHIRKREKLSISTYVPKYLVSELQLAEYCVETSSSSALDVWTGTVGDCSVDPHVMPHRLTGSHSRYVYMICQSCWKMCHWQWEHEYGTCVMCEVFRITAIMTDGSVQEDHSRFESFVRTLRRPVDNRRTVDACQTIRNCPGNFARMRRSVMRRVEACNESHGGHLEQLL